MSLYKYISVIILIATINVNAQVKQLQKDLDKATNYSIFSSLLSNPEIYYLIESTENLTIVVPNDKAFNAFMKENGMTFKELQNYYKLESLILNHMSTSYSSTGNDINEFKSLSGIRNSLNNLSTDYVVSESNMKLLPSNEVLGTSYNISYFNSNAILGKPSLFTQNSVKYTEQANLSK